MSHRRRSAGPASAAPRLPSMGVVSVAELSAILTEQPGSCAEAVGRAIGVALLVAGYPADIDVVAAADAFDVLDNAGELAVGPRTLWA